MKLVVNEAAWHVPANRLPARPHNFIKQDEIRLQVTHLLEIGVIHPSQAMAHSQVHMTPKPNGKCLDFRNLNRVFEPLGYPIPNIQQMLARIGSKRPKVFGVMDLTSGYHQGPLSRPDSKLHFP